jgi:hypothetical protein
MKYYEVFARTKDSKRPLRHYIFMCYDNEIAEKIVKEMFEVVVCGPTEYKGPITNLR